MAEWQPIESAPTTRSVRVKTLGGWELNARQRAGFVTTLGKPTLGWVADDGQQYPPCWTDGVCWEENADGSASDPPTHWKPLPPEGREA